MTTRKTTWKAGYRRSYSGFVVVAVVVVVVVQVRRQFEREAEGLRTFPKTTVE
jgi:hypothetical protein